MMRTGETD